ncbi:hypothetical protein [Streptomyces sp. NA04227]|uniref:hypothetical protein n=1 Tax=Streptomyces sp. NA04227 TaxID=2742136 RepID=UPI0020CA5CE6|nr:hypothetical protein [Streptomyces sp. NA04227]
MARRPLPRILSNPGARLTRGRELARSAAGGATDVLHPLLTISRGLRRLATAGRLKWSETPKDRRGPLLFFVASLILVVALVPYGPLLAGITLMAAAGWAGREREPATPEADEADRSARLQALYEALVPHFSVPEDPEPRFAHGGEWDRGFGDHAFDADGRVSALTVHYPPYFPDGDPEARARVERLLHAKAGRGREYHFGWDEESNILELTVLDALPTGVRAQTFVTSADEAVLGFTDPDGVPRTIPVAAEGDGAARRLDLPPVLWRTGPRSTEPHLLAVGQPGSGTTTLLRSLALQALRQGEVVVVDGGGTGEYAFLSGLRGVLAVECGLAGALATLEWAAHETERRLIAANRARQAGQPLPQDTVRPLWVLLDRPCALGHLAAADGREDPQSLLRVPLRHGRAAGVTVVVAEQFDGFDSLAEPVLRHTGARVVLGRTNEAQTQLVLGSPPHTTPVDSVPPGRGYARLGTGPVHRLQVPATPDPLHPETDEAAREAVLGLLPASADGDCVEVSTAGAEAVGDSGAVAANESGEAAGSAGAAGVPGAAEAVEGTEPPAAVAPGDPGDSAEAATVATAARTAQVPVPDSEKRADTGAGGRPVAVAEG